MNKLVDSIREWFSPSRKKELAGTAKQHLSSEISNDYKSLRIQPTPNPHACQFITNKAIVSSGTVNFDSVEEASGDAFAEELFNIYGVENAFIKENFLTVTKSPVVGWNTIVESIEEVIETHLTFYENSQNKAETSTPNPVNKEMDLTKFLNFSDEEKLKIVNAALDQAIRPALANDGGDLILMGIKGNIIQIHYQGACGTCPSATQGTLKYIESFLQDNLHPDLTVEAN